jgi:neutral ceramidase
MIHVGFAESDVTPKLGSQCPGGMKARLVNEVHDPLKAVAMVLRASGNTVALVGLDALFVTAEITASARKRIEAEAKIPGDHVLIGASHTHSGGPVATCFESEADPAYCKLVADRIADAVIAANLRMHEAEVGVGNGSEPSISFNRRFLMRNGRQETHPGKGNPDIVHPAGPIDPEVGVLAARAPGGALMGLFINFACHLTVGNGAGFSADYVFQIRESLRKHYGNHDLPVGFLLGAAGDVTQVDNLRPGREFGTEWCAIFGQALASETEQAVGRMVWTRDVDLGAVRTAVKIPIRDEHDEPKGPDRGLGAGTVAEEIYRREHDHVAEERRRTPILDCEVQAIRIGNLGIATNGAEFFCQLGLDIKAASPFPKTWVVSLANDWVGYVPTPSAYFAGGYEPRTARSAKLAPWAGQALVEGALTALGKVAPKKG